MKMKKLMIAALAALMACAGGEKEVENGITITGKVDSPLSGIITLSLLEGNTVAAGTLIGHTIKNPEISTDHKE